MKNLLTNIYQHTYLPIYQWKINITNQAYTVEKDCKYGVIKSFILALITSAFCLLAINPALAANLSSDILKQTPTEISVSLSNAANELKFLPNHLEFVSGKRYKLRLTNPSQLKHYFTAKDFADAIWTQKVEAGNVEIKGAIRELELKPGAEAEWVFVPLKPGTYRLRCTVPGHTEAGMTGDIKISE